MAQARAMTPTRWPADAYHVEVTLLPSGMEGSGQAPQDRGRAEAYASYFAGMDASMQQKVALTTTHFPVTGVIADMGSGSGRGIYDLACLHPTLQVVGIDINQVAVATAAQRWQRPNPRYVHDDIADAVFEPGSLDGILDSSVLHHVTSFTGYSTAALEMALDHQVAALRPNGVLIIRDFVIPDGPEEWCSTCPAAMDACLAQELPDDR